MAFGFTELLKAIHRDENVVPTVRDTTIIHDEHDEDITVLLARLVHRIAVRKSEIYPMWFENDTNNLTGNMTNTLTLCGTSGCPLKKIQSFEAEEGRWALRIKNMNPGCAEWELHIVLR